MITCREESLLTQPNSSPEAFSSQFSWKQTKDCYWYKRNTRFLLIFPFYKDNRPMTQAYMKRIPCPIVRLLSRNFWVPPDSICSAWQKPKLFVFIHSSVTSCRVMLERHAALCQHNSEKGLAAVCLWWEIEMEGQQKEEFYRRDRKKPLFLWVH